jgi:hypothetical protein
MNKLSSRVLLFILCLAAVPAFAVDRMVSITAPAETRPGVPVHVAVIASTDAVDGEQIGFLHAQYSLDGGKTWVAICFEEKAGALLERGVDFTPGDASAKVLVRVRVAFRGGKAGDVDYKGGAISWDDTWANWRAPVSKFAIIYVR